MPPVTDDVEWGFVVCSLTEESIWQQYPKWFETFEEARNYASRRAAEDTDRTLFQVWEAVRKRGQKKRVTPAMKVLEIPA